MKINFPSCVYFYIYPIFHWGDIIKKKVFKRSVGKKDIRERFGYIGMLLIEGGLKPLTQYQANQTKSDMTDGLSCFKSSFSE